MPKRLANGLTLLSAVVCVGSIALIWRSFIWMDTVGKGSAYAAYTLEGRFALTRTDRWGDAGPFYFRSHPAPTYQQMVRMRMGEAKGLPWLGLHWRITSRDDFFLVLPLWLLPLLTAIPPVRWWRARRREGGRGFPVEGAAAG